MKILERGGLVAFPTETVYGLGADAGSAGAVRRIFAAKGRPADHPVIVHLASADWLPRFAAAVPRAAEILAARFWPGPLTLVLPRAPGVLDLVTGGQDTVGLRVPGNDIAQALLRGFGSGIAAPSANRFGRLSPTRPEHVRAELGADVDLVLDGGPSVIGLESTIVDLAGERPAILRPGAISAEEVSAALGCPVAVPERAERRAPGTLASHYAPRTPLKIAPPGSLERDVADALERGERPAVLAPGQRPPSLAGRTLVWREAPADAAAYAHGLYAALRELDAAGCSLIVVEAPPGGQEWAAIRDRLTRASVP